MTVNLKLYRGTKRSIPETLEDGAVYVATDEQSLYVDVGEHRIKIGSVDKQKILEALGYQETELSFEDTQGNISSYIVLAKSNS